MSNGRLRVVDTRKLAELLGGPSNPTSPNLERARELLMQATLAIPCEDDVDIVGAIQLAEDAVRALREAAVNGEGGKP